MFGTRIARLFAYGFLSVVLLLYPDQAGFGTAQIGLLLTSTLIGDTLIWLWITTQADRIGRKRMLLAGAGLTLFAGVVFVLTRSHILLLMAATIGGPGFTEYGRRPGQQRPSRGDRLRGDGVGLGPLFSRLTPGIEVVRRLDHPSIRSRLGLHRSRRVVFKEYR